MPQFTRSLRPVRSVGLVSALVLAAVSAGCNNDGRHGKYTQEGVALANQRLQEIKSGTEWQMAQQQYLAGDIDKALKSVDKSIGMNPRVAKSHVLRGRILIEKNRLEDARISLNTAEELDPQNVEAQYFLGIVHERFRQYDQALARYNRAMDLDVNNPQYVTAAAEMLMENGRLDEAESLITERRKYFEYNAAMRQTLGHIAMLRGDNRLAAQHFNEAALLAPTDSRVLEDLIQAQMACAQFADAETNLARLIEKDDNKDRRDLKQLRARCLVSMDKPVEARTILLELTSDSESGRDLRSWFELGNVAAILKDKGHLRVAASRAVAIAPDRPEGYLLRGMFARLDNRPEDALAAFDQAAARSSKDISPLLLKALVLQDLNRIGAAQATLQDALARDPESAKARFLLDSMNRSPTGVASHPESP